MTVRDFCALFEMIYLGEEFSGGRDSFAIGVDEVDKQSLVRSLKELPVVRVRLRRPERIFRGHPD